MCCIWQCMAYTVLQSRPHIPVCAAYGSVWHILSPQSRPHIPVYALYGSVWDIHSPRAGPTSLYVLHMAVYGIYSPPEQGPHPCMCCIWQCMAYAVLQSRRHIPVYAVYGNVWHIESPGAGPTSLYLFIWQCMTYTVPPEQMPHPCMCCIWQCMAYTVPQSRPHVPVCAVYGSIWHIQSSRAGATCLYVLYLAVYGIYSPPEQGPHPCMCCIWQCMGYTFPRAGPTSLYVLYMAVYGIYIPPEQALHPCMCCIWQCMGYTFPQSRPYIPVCAVYGSVWDIHSPRAGPTSLYVLYMAVYGIYIPPEQALHPCMWCIWQCMGYTFPQSRPYIPVCAVDGSVWDIHSPRAGPTSVYVLYMAVYGIYIPPEQALHPCMCCIWQCMGYTFPQSRPYIPVCAVYGSVWDIHSPRACPYIPVCAVYGSVWDIHSPRAGPTSLYVLYMAVYGIYSPPE